MFLQNTETWLTFVPNVACLPHSICFLADCHIRRRREDGVVITSPTLPIERPQFKPVRTSKPYLWRSKSLLVTGSWTTSSRYCADNHFSGNQMQLFFTEGRIISSFCCGNQSRFLFHRESEHLQPFLWVQNQVFFLRRPGDICRCFCDNQTVFFHRKWDNLQPFGGEQSQSWKVGPKQVSFAKTVLMLWDKYLNKCLATSWKNFENLWFCRSINSWHLFWRLGWRMHGNKTQWINFNDSAQLVSCQLYLPDFFHLDL